MNAMGERRITHADTVMDYWGQRMPGGGRGVGGNKEGVAPPRPTKVRTKKRMHTLKGGY